MTGAETNERPWEQVNPESATFAKTPLGSPEHLATLIDARELHTPCRVKKSRNAPPSRNRVPRIAR